MDDWKTLKRNLANAKLFDRIDALYREGILGRLKPDSPAIPIQFAHPGHWLDSRQPRHKETLCRQGNKLLFDRNDVCKEQAEWVPKNPKLANSIMEIPFPPECGFNKGIIDYHCPSRRPYGPPYRLKHDSSWSCTDAPPDPVKVKVTSLLIRFLETFQTNKKNDTPAKLTNM